MQYGTCLCAMTDIKDSFRSLKKTMVSAVLCTDMAEHGPTLKRIAIANAICHN